MAEALALWNGELMPLADVRVSVLDRGWLFGDAAYEVLRLYGGRPFLLAEHELRLARSLAGLKITAPPGGLGEKVERLVKGGGAGDGIVYVQISRGAGPRTHLPPKDFVPNELVYVQELDHATLARKRADGVAAELVRDQRWGRCDLKTVNLLGNVLAADEARARGADEAILVDGGGFVTEGANTTFFGVRAGKLMTTPLTQGILPGITRDLIIGLARDYGLTVREVRVGEREVAQLDEVFLTGTVTEVMPVVKIGGRPVGRGVPGAVTRDLYAAFQAATRKI